MADAPWRVFVSHTSELRDYPRAGSYVNAVERAISACGHVVVDKTLAARERILGPDHPDTLRSRNNLALAYRDAGREEEAKRLDP